MNFVAEFKSPNLQKNMHISPSYPVSQKLSKGIFKRTDTDELLQKFSFSLLQLVEISVEDTYFNKSKKIILKWLYWLKHFLDLVKKTKQKTSLFLLYRLVPTALPSDCCFQL